MKKRVFALLLSGILCLCLCGTAFAADDEGHWDFSDPSVGPQWVPSEQTPDTPDTPTDPDTPITPPSGPSGNDYVPFTPSTPKLPVSTDTTTQGGVSTTETTATPNASTQGSVVTATVSLSLGNEIVKQAVSNKSENVVIAPKVTGNVTKAEVSIPAATVGQIGNQTSASLTVSTPVANVTIPNGGLSSLSSAGGDVTVAAAQTDHTVELSVTAGGKTVDSIPGGLTLTVPVSNATPGTVAVLLHADGTRETIRKSVASENSIIISLDGSAKVEIVDNSK